MKQLVLLTAGLTFALLISCNRPEVVHDLGDTSFELVDQDSSRVIFPDDYSGRIVVAGFIFTNCPDVCGIITANLANIRREMENREDVRFVNISFDPERDTPSVLKKYMRSYKLDEQHFTMLTGDTATVDSLLDRLDITARKAGTDPENRANYLMNHTNRILVMDGAGRVRFEYPGSVVPPQNVIEDINRLR